MRHKRSAGLLMYRVREGMIEVLLAHPGGPFFRNKDNGHWTIPKGEYGEDEDPLIAAQREFGEETGCQAPQAPHAPDSRDRYLDLGEITQKGGKVVRAWAFEGNCEPATLMSNTFEMEWPPKSGRMQAFPEVDRCEFFALADARRKIKEAQRPLLDALERQITTRASSTGV